MEPIKKLFIDIETHYVTPLEYQDELIKRAFMDHYYDSSSEVNAEDQFKAKAGLTPELGQVICVSLGYEDPNTGEWRSMTYSGMDEKDILEKTSDACSKFFQAKYPLCGFNSNAFDIPFLTRRMIKYRMKVIPPLNTHGLKPWEVTNVDVMSEWKLQSWNNTSLQMVAAHLGIKSKSEEVSGRNMYEIQIDQMPWDELRKYCEEDVFVTKEIYKVLAQTLL